jgi:competence protein ComEA
MALRPIVRALVVPILGLSLSGIEPGRPPLAEEEAPPPPGPKVNINQAHRYELHRLPGVGSEMTAKIVRHRMKHGPFKRPEDLMQIKGIGEKFFVGLKPYVVVSGPTTAVTKIKSRA